MSYQNANYGRAPTQVAPQQQQAMPARTAGCGDGAGYSGTSAAVWAIVIIFIILIIVAIVFFFWRGSNCGSSQNNCNDKKDCNTRC